MCIQENSAPQKMITISSQGKVPNVFVSMMVAAGNTAMCVAPPFSGCDKDSGGSQRDSCCLLTAQGLIHSHGPTHITTGPAGCSLGLKGIKKGRGGLESRRHLGGRMIT